MMSKHATAGSETPSGRATRCISPKPAKQTCRNGRVEVVTTEATKPDGEAMEDIHEQLAQNDLLTGQHLVDSGYVYNEKMVISLVRYHIDYIGQVARGHAV